MDAEGIRAGFAVICLLYLMFMGYFLSTQRSPAEIKREASFIMGFLCSVAAGFCAYYFTGTLGLNFEIFGLSGNATAGFGAFVLVLVVWYRAMNKPVSGLGPADLMGALDRVFTGYDVAYTIVRSAQEANLPSDQRTDHLPSITAQREGDAITFRRRDSGELVRKLSIEEVKSTLSDEEKQTLLKTELEMRRKISEWEKEKAAIKNFGDANVETKKRLLRLANGLFYDLESIFEAVRRTLGGELDDHYGSERYIASQADGLLKQLELEARLGPSPVPSASPSVT